MKSAPACPRRRGRIPKERGIEMQSQDTRFAPRHRANTQAPTRPDGVGRARGTRSRRDFRRGMDLADRARADESFYSLLAAAIHGDLTEGADR